jgi:hypothetical protein
MGIKKRDVGEENYKHLQEASEQKFGHKKAVTRYLKYLIQKDKNNNDKK